MPQIAKVLILVGAGLLVVGLVFAFTGGGTGKLPGDVVIKGKNSVTYIPIVSSIIVSIILSLVFWFVSRYFGD